jgi:hypothetical protein
MSYQYNTATSFSDETYLESFVEAVSWTLPSDLQRSLQHLQMLDNDSANIMKQWRDSQDSCLQGVEAALLGAYRGDNHPITIIPPPSSMPTSSSTAAAASANIATPTVATAKKSPASSERKKACYKCRNKKVRCDGQQPFCLNKAEYNNGIATATASSSGASFSDVGGDSSDYNSPPQKKTKLSNNNDDEKDDDTTNNKASSSTTTTTAPLPRLDKSRPPNTAEIQNVLQKRNPHYNEQCAAITDMYHKLQQCSREKIHTAHQLKSMIDMALGRLSRDMKKFENDLGLLPSSSSSAAAVSAGGGGGGMGASLLPVAELNQSQSVLGGGGGDAATTTAPTTTAAAAAAKPVHATLPPNVTNNNISNNKNLAAIQTTPNAPEWILANIISFDEYTRMYTLSDEDQSSNEIYTIPSRQVRPLNTGKGNNNERTKNNNNWVKGDEIYAVYPDTTSFYPATVVSSSSSSSSGFVMVHFNDDWDANGVIHEKAVPMQYVMKAP